MTDADRDRVMAYTNDLPWMRRERIDRDYRRISRELEALIAEGDAWAPFYELLLANANASLSLVNTIEDMVDESLRGGYSVRVERISTEGSAA